MKDYKTYCIHRGLHEVCRLEFDRDIPCLSIPCGLSEADIKDMYKRYTGVELVYEGVYVMPFGKYEGIPISDVPIGYLEWAVDNITKPIVLLQVEKELKIRLEIT